ncbi:MAG: aminotransferase class I/II-fold pyridoxal phosphate-dependent enzyme [Clostridium sp.]|nr:aminotransferase class I/II-fold pyridoxal phosphate-dependent enzyme [Clostridium sp.]
MQAIILAAGMGRRLKELTKDKAKCMVEVNGISLIERMLLQLDMLKPERIIVVTGYEREKLEAHILGLPLSAPVIFCENSIFYKTNNIYSLYLAKEYLKEKDTLLLESDLIFETSVLEQLLGNPYPNLALVAKFESWMDGTVVTLSGDGRIQQFLTRKDFRFEDIGTYYKTVNIYKFSKEFSNRHYVPFLEAYSKALGNNEYYEQVLKIISMIDVSGGIRAEGLKSGFWYEIDDEQDLDIAESIFTNLESRLSKLEGRYGGYWRYPYMKDFCYLVNPYFPNQRLLDEMKASFERLVYSYPSGLEVNCLLAAKSLGLKREHVCVGNGAAELIRAFLEEREGPAGIIRPVFEEYNAYLKHSVVFETEDRDFRYGSGDIIDFFESKSLETLILVNPDNPSGNYISPEELMRLIGWTGERGIRFVVDESFVDFVNEEDTLLREEILAAYPHLIVIKSISKSYGVPGLRLGVLASWDQELTGKVKAGLPVWNINSFGEYFLQIFEKYMDDYRDSLEKFREARERFVKALQEIRQLRFLSGSANFLLCEVKDGCSASVLTEMLLNRYNILIKDLSSKKGMGKRQCVRLAVRREEDNMQLAAAIKSILR